MERRIAALVAGRARWVAKLKAKGKPFPNSRKGCANRTPEQRAAIAEVKADRAETRRRYSAQKSQVQRLRFDTEAVRALAPTYVKKSDVSDPNELAKIDAAMQVFNDIPVSVDHLDSELAEEAAMLRSRAFRALTPAMGAVILESLRRQKEREAKEWGEQLREMVMRASRERAEHDAKRHQRDSA
jgi:hypothetical protein